MEKENTRMDLPWTEETTEKCNARMNHGDGTCLNLAGEGTEHIGNGRCAVHGGDVQPNIDIKELVKGYGLGHLQNVAERMDADQAEYMFHVGNAGLILRRGQIIAAMEGADPKSLSDLTMALIRVDKILAGYRQGAAEAKEEKKTNSAETAERERLAALQVKFAAEN